jgi:hypothetical protein
MHDISLIMDRFGVPAILEPNPTSNPAYHLVNIEYATFKKEIRTGTMSNFEFFQSKRLLNF